MRKGTWSVSSARCLVSCWLLRFSLFVRGSLDVPLFLRSRQLGLAALREKVCSIFRVVILNMFFDVSFGLKVRWIILTVGLVHGSALRTVSGNHGCHL